MVLKVPGEPHLKPSSEVPLLTWLLLLGSETSISGKGHWLVQEPDVCPAFPSSSLPHHASTQQCTTLNKLQEEQLITCVFLSPWYFCDVTQ